MGEPIERVASLLAHYDISDADWERLRPLIRSSDRAYRSGNKSFAWMKQPTPQTDENVSPPIVGMWVIESDDELTPEIVKHAESVLTSAAREGRQVIVIEGITFKWRPTPVEREASSPALDRWQQGYEDAWKRLHEPDAIHGQCAAPALDVERLVQAWAGHMEKDHPDDDYEAPTTDCAEKVAAEYARLSTPEPE